jgi:EmrB/QacA subfamily drug resistance transporter
MVILRTRSGTAKPGSATWTLLLTSVAFFMVAMDALVVTTALPAIQRNLHAGVSTLEWTVNAYSLTDAAGIITAAAFGDRLGRRSVFAGGLALFTLASAACALAPTAGWLLTARAVQGIGAAAVMPLSLTILTSSFSPARRGAVIGIWGAIGGLAVASGPVIGGAITQGLDWHWIFWVNVPVGLLATLGTLGRLAPSRGPDVRLDLPGLVLATSAATSLVWGIVRSGTLGWGSEEVLATLFAGAALLAAFVAWERRAPAPMLPPRLFVNRTFAAANAGAFLMIGALMGAAFLVSQYFQFSLGDSPLETGVRILPWTATPILVAPLAGKLSDRVGPRPLMLAGLLLQGVGLGWLSLTATAGAGYAGLVLPLLTAGIGVSMAFPTVPAAALGAVAEADMGKASGANNTMQRFGGVFGVAIVTAVFAAHGHLGSSASFAAGFQPAVGVAAALSILGGGSALLVARRPHTATAVAAEIAPKPVVAA